MAWENQLIELVNSLQKRMTDLELEIEQLKISIVTENRVTRSHIVKVKNHEYLSCDTILRGLTYVDLTPDKAFEYYNNNDSVFILLDVSSRDYVPQIILNNSLKIPLEELPYRFLEISSKTIPVLILSEDGRKSVLACELLNKYGYFNVMNVSGGYKFWQNNSQISKKIAS